MISSRRTFLTGFGATLITAPAIVRAGSLMPIEQMIEPLEYKVPSLYFQDRIFWVLQGEQAIYFSAPFAPVRFNGVELFVDGGFGG